MHKTALAFGLAALLLAAPAAAQYQMVSPMLYHGPAISLRDHVNSQNAATPTPTPDQAARPATLTYRPDPARRRDNLARFVAQVRPFDPQGADNLAQLFARGDFLASLQADLTPMGLSVDNVADAYTTYWISAWQASRGETGNPPKAQVAAVQAQTAKALSATPAFARASNADKQDMAESLWLQLVVLESAVNGAKNNPEQLRSVGQAAAQGARGMGLDVTRMTLTDQGFVAK